MRRSYLVLHDYGTGGVWSCLRAESADDIRSKFPTLVVYESAPGWMTEAELEDIRERSSYDVETAERDDPLFFGRLRIRGEPPSGAEPTNGSQH